MGALCNPKACLSNVSSIYRGYLARGVVRFSSIMWQKALFCVFPKLACGEAISSVNPFMSIDLAARILRAYKNWRTKHVLSGLEPKIIRLEKLGNIPTNKKKRNISQDTEMVTVFRFKTGVRVSHIPLDE